MEQLCQPGQWLADRIDDVIWPEMPMTTEAHAPVR